LEYVKITVVYDNVSFDRSFGTGFGFSCVVETEKSCILFDTGGDYKILSGNLRRAGIPLNALDALIISHNHFDHTGGLNGLLRDRPDIPVYLPGSVPLRNKVSAARIQYPHFAADTPDPVAEGIDTTGLLGRVIKEQGVVIHSTEGLILVTGCAHPGIAEIAATTRLRFEKPIYLLMGGFHHPPLRAAEELCNLGVEYSAPSHCTGKAGIRAFQEVFGEKCLRSGAGRIITIGKRQERIH